MAYAICELHKWDHLKFVSKAKFHLTLIRTGGELNCHLQFCSEDVVPSVAFYTYFCHHHPSIGTICLQCLFVQTNRSLAVNICLFAETNVANILFLLMDGDRNMYEKQQVKWYRNCKTIYGIRNHSQYELKADGTLLLKRISDDSICVVRKLHKPSPQPSVRLALHPGNCVACIYHSNWYFGCLTKIGDGDFNKVKVSFLEAEMWN